MSTPTANMDPDQPNAETRASTARLAVSEIIRVPLQVATGPTCTPQGVCQCPIRARFTFKCATSGRRGTLFSCKCCCGDPDKHGGWAGRRAKMVAHLTGPGKGDKYFNDQRAGAGQGVPKETSTLQCTRYNHNQLRIQNTCDSCDFVCMRF